MSVIDYSESFPDALLAQGNDTNVLILFHLDTPATRADGRKATYELCYRWLSVACQNSRDEAWCCVQGAEVTYWQYQEISHLVRAIKAGNDVSLFEHFKLH